MKKILLSLLLFLTTISSFASLLAGSYDLTFYGVQSVFNDGTIESGCSPSTLRITGPTMLPEVNGNETIGIWNYPQYQQLSEATCDSENYDGGVFVVAGNGHCLIYFNEDLGYANLFYYSTPGNLNTCLWRMYYSTDPSKAGSGASGGSRSIPRVNSGSGYNSGSSSSSSICRTCGGSGVCQSCHGKGGEWRDTGYYTGSGNHSWISCPSCNGSKRCYNCHGSGRQR